MNTSNSDCIGTQEVGEGSLATREIAGVLSTVGAESIDSELQVAGWLQTQATDLHSTIGALIIACTIFGVPYYSYNGPYKY